VIGVKKYSNYTAKKFRLPRRIIFFSVVALIIVVLTVIVGNVLKARLEGAEIDTSDVLTTTSPDEGREENNEGGEESVPHDEALSCVKAGYLDLKGITETAKAELLVENLKSLGYNAVSFPITDEGGAVTYASPAVVASSRLPASEALIPYEVLSAAVRRAKGLGMRLCGVITASESPTDPIVAGELSALGFDEFVVRGFESVDTVDNARVARIESYVSSLRGVCSGNICVGVAFSEGFFKAASNAPYIEKLYRIMEFMAIDLTSVSAEGAKSAAETLQGSFTAYLLRPLLSGSDKELSAEIDTALTDATVAARQYVSGPVSTSDDDE